MRAAPRCGPAWRRGRWLRSVGRCNRCARCGDRRMRERGAVRFPGMSRAAYRPRPVRHAAASIGGRGCSVRATGTRTHGHTRGRGVAPARRNSQIAPRRTWTAIAWPGARRTGAGVRPAACATVPGEADGVRHSTADRRPAARAAAPGAQGPTPGRRHVPRRYSQAANRAISGASAITSTWSWDRCANARHNATSASQSNVPWSTPVASSMTV